MNVVATNKNAQQALDLLASRWRQDSYPDLTRKYYKLLEAFCEQRDEALALAKSLISSEREYERFFAVQIINIVFNPTEQEHVAEARTIIRALAEMAKTERHIAILTQIAYALGKPYLKEATKPLMELARHDDVNVVFAAVQSFNAIDKVPEYAIKRLIQLTSSKDADVRNWATFQLGTQMSDVHREDITEALRARLRDRHNETRCEAFRGLAYRSDPAGIEPLRDWLLKKAKTDRVMSLEVEAAGAYGSPQLYESLQVATKSIFWKDSDLMKWAMARCSPNEKTKNSVPAEWERYGDKP